MSVKQYFGTDGIRGKVGKLPITADFVLKLGWAAGQVFADPLHRPKILVGKDTRISGYMFESALQAGLSAAGVDIALLGPMPTPAIAYLTRTFKAQASIVISASHNSFQDNGFKFFSARGLKLDDTTELAIESFFNKPLVTVAPYNLGRASRINDANGRYIEFCKSTVPLDFSLEGLHIIVDCANGATYNAAPKVFSELGAKVTAINDQPDGFNINKDCGSTKPSYMRYEVLKHRADLGIAFDGDGDRCLMIDEKGQILDGDDMLYIIAGYFNQHKNIRSGVIGTIMSNMGLELAIKATGVPFVRVPVGDRYIINELNKRNWSIGGEPSGHIVCKNYTTTGDGIVASLQILAAMHYQEKSLSALKSGMKKLPQKIFNVEVKDKYKVFTHDKTKQAIQHIDNKLNRSGRLLVRCSGTESLIRIMLESEDSNLIDQLGCELSGTIKDIALKLSGS